jgi:hypothetical protein
MEKEEGKRGVTFVPVIGEPVVKRSALFVVGVVGIVLISGCTDEMIQPVQSPEPQEYPKIASWLAKKDEIIASGRPYALVMSGWFTPQEAEKIRSQNPRVLLLAGLTVNWVYDDSSWITFMETVASSGRETPLAITDEMYLTDTDAKDVPSAGLRKNGGTVRYTPRIHGILRGWNSSHPFTKMYSINPSMTESSLIWSQNTPGVPKR